MEWHEKLHQIYTIFWFNHYSNFMVLFKFYRYNEETFNCYTFVLTFLRNLCYGNLSKAATSRTVFCENFIVPRTTAAGKYISLYRKLSDMGCYIHRHPAEVASVTLPNRWQIVMWHSYILAHHEIWWSQPKLGKRVVIRNCYFLYVAAVMNSSYLNLPKYFNGHW